MDPMNEQKGGKRRTRRVVIGGAAGLILTAAVGGAALAQTPTARPSGGPPARFQQERDAFLAALAAKLGKSPEEVKAAVVAVEHDQVAQRVKDGKLTQAQADEVNRRIDQAGGLGFFGHGPGFGPPPGGGPGRRPGGPGPLGDVATFLGMSPADLTQAVRSGKSLAQIAEGQGKSRADLTAFLATQEKTRLDQAVKDGKLSQDQESKLLSEQAARIDRMVDRSGPPGPPPGGGPRPGGRRERPTPTL